MLVGIGVIPRDGGDACLVVIDVKDKTNPKLIELATTLRERLPRRASLFTGQYPSLHGVTQTDGIGNGRASAILLARHGATVFAGYLGLFVLTVLVSARTGARPWLAGIAIDYTLFAEDGVDNG